MKGFAGFPAGKMRTVPLPEQFFTDLLPTVDHLGEMKVTLYAFCRLNLKQGEYRFLQREDFSEDDLFMRGLSASPRQAEEILDDALERAEARGTLLHVMVEDAQAIRGMRLLVRALQTDSAARAARAYASRRVLDVHPFEQ